MIYVALILKWKDARLKQAFVMFSSLFFELLSYDGFNLHIIMPNNTSSPSGKVMRAAICFCVVCAQARGVSKSDSANNHIYIYI